MMSLLFGNGDSTVTCRFITVMQDSSRQAVPNIPTCSCFSVIVLYTSQHSTVSGYDDVFHKCHRSPANSSSLFIVQKIDLHVTIFEKK